MRAFRWLRRGGLLGLIALLTTALAVVGAEPAVAEEDTYTISGTVTFQGTPQSGVKVCELLTGSCDVTDGGGGYSLSGVGSPAKVYASPGSNDSSWVETWYPRYTSSEYSWLEASSPAWPDAVDIELQAAPTVSGTVTNTSGEAVKKARVCVAGSANCVTTSARGEYRLLAQIPKHDSLTLVAKAPGYRPAQTTTTVTTNVTITLTKVKPAKVRACKPKLVGSKKVGTKLRVKCSSATTAVHFTYRWYRNGHRIAGAHGRTYRLTWADWRKNIKVKVVATKTGYRKTVRTSKGTGWIRWSEWHRR